MRRRGAGALLAVLAAAPWALPARAAPPQEPGRERGAGAVLAAIARTADATDEQVDALERDVLAASGAADTAAALSLHEAWADCLRARLYRLRDSERVLRRALDLARDVAPRDPSPLLRIAIALADVQRELGERAAAQAGYDRAAAWLDNGDRGELAARVSLGRAALLDDRGHPANALLELDRARALFAAAGDREGSARTELLRGRCLTTTCRYHEALDTLEQVTTTWRELGDEVEEAIAGVSLALVLVELGRYDDALAEIARARGTLERRGCAHGIAWLQLAKGFLLGTFGRVREGLAEYEAAEQRFRELGHRPGAALAKSKRCIAYHLLGRVADGQRCLVELDSEAEGLDDLRVKANLATARGMLVGDAGDLEASARHHGEAARIWAQIGNHKTHWVAITRRARQVNSLGRYQEALDAYADAEPFFAGIGHRYLPTLMTNRGLVLGNQSRHREALAEYLRAVDRLERALRTQVHGIGPAASQQYRAAQHWVLNNIVGSLGRLPDLRLDDVAAAYHARQVFHGANLFASARHVPLPADLAAQEAALGREHRARVRERERLALDPVPAAASAHAAALARVSAAVERLEQQRAALFEEARLRDGSRSAPAFSRPARLSEVQQLLPPGVALAEYVVGADATAVLLVTRTSAAFRPLGDPGDLAGDAARVRELLAPAGLQDAFDVEVHAALRGLGRRVIDPVLDALPDGFQLRTLLVSPDGGLYDVPFEALLVADDAGETARDWPFLIRRAVVAYVHSGTRLRDMLALAGTIGPRGEPGRLVAFAHPSYPHERPAPAAASCAPLAEASRFGSLEPLPGTAEEVLAIASLLAGTAAERDMLENLAARARSGQLDAAPLPVRGAGFTLFLRERATEAALKRDPAVASARILHLACHGFADSGTPHLSHLALARSSTDEADTGEDGYLLLGELQELGLRAELLTLSACATGAGRLLAHEGTESLARAGLDAGAQAVIATLWQVRDQAARALIETFYRNWLRSGLSRAAALAAAKRAAIAGDVDVRQWAAFVLWDAQACRE
jgi:CHAT domain-containing protein/tetratricopeptide (TPR) repeat protein